MSLITIQTFDNPLEANLVKLQLESFDIPAVIKDEQMVGLIPIYNITLGGIKLQVSEKDFEKATALLAELKKSDEQLHCPKCDSTEFYVNYKSTKTLKGRMAVLISWLTGTYPPLHFDRVNTCKSCGYTFVEHQD